MTGLADVDGFQLFIQVCVWPRFPLLVMLLTMDYKLSMVTNGLLLALIN